METARSPSNSLFTIISFNERSAEPSLRHLPNCSTVRAFVDLRIKEQIQAALQN
jgi:hypothetical protein